MSAEKGFETLFVSGPAVAARAGFAMQADLPSLLMREPATQIKKEIDPEPDAVHETSQSPPDG
jgi:hypothetical protein